MQYLFDRFCLYKFVLHHFKAMAGLFLALFRLVFGFIQAGEKLKEMNVSFLLYALILVKIWF